MSVETTGMSFDVLQRDRLAGAWRADLPGSLTPHVVLALPSYSVDRTVLEHYGDRVPPLENRYLYLVLRARELATRVVYLSSLSVPREVLDGYLDLVDATARTAVIRGSRTVTPDDPSPRPLAEKLLDRGDLIDELRRMIRTEPALIEAWNVTEAEAALAVALGAPINGTAPGLRRLATKSNGRRLLREAGVPTPAGIEDVRSLRDVATAIVRLRAQRPDLRSVVVKLDDSVAGDGNVVVPLAGLGVDGSAAAPGHATVEHAVDALLPGWYKSALAAGGIVEERIEGDFFCSPSGQASIAPDGAVTVVGTHEQRLGGAHRQVYQGCAFPADPAYAPLIAMYTGQVGRRLAAEGAVGRFSVDFVACRRNRTLQLHALEINLRKGGTTHTLGVTRLVRGGAYQPDAGVFVSAAGRQTCYGATDNLLDEAWVGRPPSDVRAAIRSAGLAFEPCSASGVVPHLLDCLKIDGRMGYTAIADDRTTVAELEERLQFALQA